MARTIVGDWHPGHIPDNAEIDPTALIETSYCFVPYRSNEPVGLRMSRGAGIYTGSMLDVGPKGKVTLGECALLTAARVVCDERIDFLDFALLSWNTIVMDNYRFPLDPDERRDALRALASDPSRRTVIDVPTRPVTIGRNVWIGFDACILPGVAIGEGTIVGARSVVADDLPALSVAVGNPARPVRRLQRATGP